MEKYDAIIVGAGISGIIAALNLKKKNKNILIIDKNNNIGGVSKNIIKGRFNFQNPVLELYLNKENDYSKDIEYKEVLELFHLVSKDTDIVVPYGKDKFINKMEDLVPGCSEVLNNFFDLVLECKEAYQYIVDNISNIDYEDVMNRYPNFSKVASLSVKEGFDLLDIPQDIQNILSTYWYLLGSSINNLNFIDYSIILLNAITYGLKVPKWSSYEVALSLVQEYLELGGILKLNSEVKNIIVEDNKVKGIELVAGEYYYTDNLLYDGSMDTLYSILINKDDIPKEVLKNINSRKIGGKLFTVHLGLNRSIEDLGLKEYMTFIYHSLNSSIEEEKQSNIAWGDLVVVIPNVVNKNASPKGTSIISLNTIYFNDIFSEYTDKDNYYRDIDEITSRLIEVFQKSLHISITEYIEEIEVVTPIDNALITNSLEGSSFGFKLEDRDNMLPRLLNIENEQYIKGLYIVNGFDGDFYSYGSNIYSGYFNSKKVGDSNE